MLNKVDIMSSVMDTWGDEPVRIAAPTAASGSTSGFRSKIPSAAVVRDDWEMDEEEEDEVGRTTGVQNKQIWEDANTKVHHPMPALVISRGSSAASASTSLPLNQPPAMRILKRPSPTVSPNQSSANLTPVGETFQEREARYQAARERIFGVSSSTSSDVQDKTNNSALKKTASPTPPPNQGISVVREPRGPSNSTPNPNPENRTDNKGFGERRTKRPPPSTTAPSTTTTTTTLPVSSSNIPI